MDAPTEQNPPLFRWVNVVVVIAICFILVALALPAVETARNAASRAKAMSNLRSLALATQQAHDIRRKLPPDDAETVYGDCRGSILYHLLPYLEEQSIYNRVGTDGPGHPGYNAAVSNKVPIFQTPADWTVGDGTMTEGQGAESKTFGLASFAWNHLCSNRRLPGDFQDGHSRTILFTEKIAGCTSPDIPGANYWGSTVPADQTPPSSNTAPVVYAADGLEPQFHPDPKTCNPNAPSGANQDIIIVAFADSNTRFFSSTIANVPNRTGNGTIWYSLMTPDQNDNQGEESDY